MGTGQNPRRGNGDGDGLNYVPVPVPIPERGLIFLPVPVPFGNGDFPPLRGGAPAGTGIPQLFAIPKFKLFPDLFTPTTSLVYLMKKNT